MMGNKLRILLFAFFIMLSSVIYRLLKKDKIPVKYSILWIGISLVTLLLSLRLNIIIEVSEFLGFETTVNFIIATLLGVLIIITLALTVIISKQKLQITKLIQEVSIIKKEIKK